MGKYCLHTCQFSAIFFIYNKQFIAKNNIQILFNKCRLCHRIADVCICVANKQSVLYKGSLSPTSLKTAIE